MSVLPLENRRTLSLNTLLLFCVSIEPFLFHILNSSQITDSASVLFAIDLGALNMILGFFTLVLADEERKLIAKDLIKEFRTDGILTFLAAAFFFISALPFFWDHHFLRQPIRYELWFVPLVIMAIRRRLPKNSEKSI